MKVMGVSEKVGHWVESKWIRDWNEDWIVYTGRGSEGITVMVWMWVGGWDGEPCGWVR